MENEPSRMTPIASLEASDVGQDKAGARKGGAGKGVLDIAKSVNWPLAGAVAASSFAAQKLPLDVLMARTPWAFRAGTVPVRTLISVALFLLINALWFST
jgi:hypothetical protein